MPARKLLAERTTMQVTWELKDRIQCYKLKKRRYPNEEFPGAESDYQVLERLFKIIDELAKIKSKKYKHQAEKYVEFDEILEQVNIPNKVPYQTYIITKVNKKKKIS